MSAKYILTDIIVNQRTSYLLLQKQFIVVVHIYLIQVMKPKHKNTQYLPLPILQPSSITSFTAYCVASIDLYIH